MPKRFLAWLVLSVLLLLLAACSDTSTSSAEASQPDQDYTLGVEEAEAVNGAADADTIAAQGTPSKISDPNGLNGVAYKFLRNGDELIWRELPAGTYNIYASARAELYGDEAPKMTITIGSQAFTQSFNSTSYQEVLFGQVTVKEGDQVSATFINDAWGGTSTTDRNLILSYISCEPTTSSTPAPTEPAPTEPAPVDGSTQQPYVIFLNGNGSNGPARTPSILENLSYIESLPFDGIVIDIPAGWQVMKKGVKLDYESEYRTYIQPLQGKLDKFPANMLRAQVDDPGDLFDDAAWNQTIENWGILARLAKDVGAKGIFFDNEEYFDKWMNYPEDYSSPTKSKEEYVAQARLRGKQMMEAMMKEFPDINVTTLHGPYKSEPKTPSYVTMEQIGPASSHELSGPLTVGMLEAQTGNARVTDGGEVYQYRTEDDFKNSYTWRDQTIASDSINSTFIPSSLKPSWSQKLDMSFGLFNVAWKAPMDPSIMRTTLTHALNTTDRFVWIYGELGEVSWLTPGGMSQDWQDAIRAAKEDAAQ
ncbi:MAG: carbohydrate-binding domain-containing protein [Trueperaceae bacterium]